MEVIDRKHSKLGLTEAVAEAVCGASGKVRSEDPGMLGLDCEVTLNRD